MLKSLSVDGEGKVQIWDNENGDCLHTLDTKGYKVLCANISKDGSKIVTGSDDKNVRIWDTTDFKC